MNCNLAEQKNNLFRMVRQEPVLRSCLCSLAASVSSGPVEFKENGKNLDSTLSKIINNDMNQFLFSAIEMVYVCGFAAFHVVRINNIPRFKILPLGTFTWFTELDSKKRSGNIVRYRVICNDGSVSEDDIHIFDYETPILTNSQEIISPLNYILSLQNAKNVQLKSVLESSKWNCDKHIAVTEQIDLKDPTTTGLSLLDDLRRYNLTGKHSGMDSHSLLKIKNHQNVDLDTATQGTFSWVHKVFSDEDGAQAKVHILPPNTNIQEIGNLEYSQLYQYLDEQFNNAIFHFFDMLPPTVNANSNSTETLQMTKNQHARVKQMSHWCEQLLSLAYATAFNVRPETVECKITPIQRLEVKGLSDFKVLQDSNILTQQDKMKIKSMFLE